MTTDLREPGSGPLYRSLMFFGCKYYKNVIVLRMIRDGSWKDGMSRFRHARS
jgi:hypothetical protein